MQSEGLSDAGPRSFFFTAANSNIEVKKGAGSLDGIYRGGVKSGIGAGSGGVI